MYTAIGWLELTDDTYESDESDRDAGIARVREYLDALKWGTNSHWHITYQNGAVLLLFAASGNRPRTYTEEISGLLDLVGDALPGSYGLVHVRDDDKPVDEGGNRFTVLRMARGAVDELPDVLLSPINPTVED